MPLSSGWRLGPYVIAATIGTGGMGEVYRARDTKLGRDVALKVLPDALAGDADYMARFQREALVMASLNHPHIASLYGLEESDGVRALVMELVEGPTLADRIKKAPLPLLEALGVAKQIAEALEYAHEKGVIHRDLKPANVKLTPEGSVKVLDFGLAKAAERMTDAAQWEISPTLPVSVSQRGVIMGTPAYMAPEQARGEPVDKRADIWAFGVVLLEMLMGKRTFSGESTTDTLAAVLTKDPDWAQLPPGTPANIRRLLLRCLERDRKKRLRDIGEARIAIEEYLADPAGALEEQGRRIPVRLVALSTVLAAALGVIAWEGVHRPEPRSDLPLRKFDLVLADLTPDTFPVISPDGQKIVYDVQTLSQPNRKLRVYGLDAGESYDVAGTEGGRRQFWSPDSEFIGFMTDRAVCKVPVRGGAPQVLYHTRENEWLNGPGSWSPDGHVIAFTSDSAPYGGLYELPAWGGSSPKLLMQSSEKLPGLNSPHFVPAGPGSNLVLYVDKPIGTIMLHNLDDGRRQVLTTGAWPAYSPTGHILFGQLAPIGFRGLWALPVSLKSLKPTGGSFSIDPNGKNESVAKDGTLVYLRGGYPKQKQLVWLDRSGRKLSEIGQPQQDMFVPSLSPDGRFVGVEGWERATGSDVWIHDIARSTKTRLTLDPAIDSRPVWSPDGKEVAFFSNRNGKLETFIQRVDGSGEAKAVLLNEIAEDWSRDGSIIIGSNWYITRNPDHSGGRRPFLHFQAGGPDRQGAKLSPDGRFVAYVSHESGRAEVYIQPFPEGRKWQVSANGGLQPRWCRNWELFYTNGDTLFAVPITTKPAFSMGTTRKLFSRQDLLDWPYPEASYDVASDGKRFVMIEPLGPIPPLTIRVAENWFAEFRDRKKANPLN